MPFDLRFLAYNSAMRALYRFSLFVTYRAAVLFVLMLLAGCQFTGRQPAPVVDKRVGEDSLIHVQPLMPPAVVSLLQKAESAQARGQLRQAENQLLRALRLQPDAPVVMRALAEVHLAGGDYASALSWAQKAAVSGPPVGRLCAQSWHIAALAAEQMGALDTQALALRSMETCRLHQSPRY